jgi:hypothetical protein
VTPFGVVEQLRCDCGQAIATCLENTFHAPPDELGWYHIPWLLAAEAGWLRYDLRRYRVHGVCNNATDALWRGLLADAPGGPVLTELGAHMLAHWKDTPEGRARLADGPPDESDDEPDDDVEGEEPGLAVQDALFEHPEGCSRRPAANLKMKGIPQ